MADFQRTRTILSEIENAEKTDMEHILRLFKECYEDFRAAGMVPEHVKVGSGDDAIQLLCWLARMTERMFRLHQDELLPLDTEKRWERAQEKLASALPVLEERKRLIEILEEKITEADSSLDMATKRQLELREELNNIQNEKRIAVADLEAVEKTVAQASAELLQEQHALDEQKALYDNKQKELEDVLHQQREILENRNAVSVQIKEKMQESSEMLKSLQEKLDMLYEEESALENHPAIANEWLKDPDAAKNIIENFQEEYRKAKQAYDRCSGFQQRITDLIETGELG